MDQSIMSHEVDLVAGLASKELGQRIVRAANAEFVRRMRDLARFLSAGNGEVTVDDLRRMAASVNLAPSHPNAWGCIFSQSGWAVVGHRRSTLASNRGREIKVWRWVGSAL